MTEEELRALELPATFKDVYGYTKVIRFIGKNYVFFECLGSGSEFSKSIPSVLEHWTHIKREEKVGYFGTAFLTTEEKCFATMGDIKLTRIYENDKLIDVKSEIVK